MTRASLT